MTSRRELTAAQFEYAQRSRKYLRELRDEARQKDLENVAYYLEMSYLLLSELIADNSAASHIPERRKRAL
jgi:hypothetical protein